MAEAMVDLADVEFELGNIEATHSNLSQAEAVFVSLEQLSGLAAIRNRQALIAYRDDDFVGAEALCRQSL